MTTNIAITSVARLTDTQHKIVAVLAAATCPPQEFPRAILTVGVGDIEAAVASGRRMALYWLGQGEAGALISSPTLSAYVRDGVPVVVLARSYADASAIAEALTRSAAA